MSCFRDCYRCHYGGVVLKSSKVKGIFGVAALIAVILGCVMFPGYAADNSVVLSILLYLPGFFVLIGLFEAWVSRDFVVSHMGEKSGLKGSVYSFVSHMGEKSGLKGSVYSFIMGCLIPGPLYLAFPLAGALLRKGISRFNVVLFIGAWSSFKVVEEIFELHFLGPRFLVLRVLLTVPFVIVVAFIVSKVCFDDK